MPTTSTDPILLTTNNIEELEDFLHSEGVFFNPLKGEKHIAHMDSYMTCIDFNILYKSFLAVKSNFSDEQWKEMIKYWKSHSYCSPNCGIIADMFSFYLNNFVKK